MLCIAGVTSLEASLSAAVDRLAQDLYELEGHFVCLGSSTWGTQVHAGPRRSTQVRREQSLQWVCLARLDASHVAMDIYGLMCCTSCNVGNSPRLEPLRPLEDSDCARRRRFELVQNADDNSYDSTEPELCLSVHQSTTGDPLLCLQNGVFQGTG